MNGATICGPRPAIASIMQRTLSSLESNSTPSRSKCTDSRPPSSEMSDRSGMRPDRLVHELRVERRGARAAEERQDVELLADAHRGLLELLDVGRVDVLLAGDRVVDARAPPVQREQRVEPAGDEREQLRAGLAAAQEAE